MFIPFLIAVLLPTRLDLTIGVTVLAGLSMGVGLLLRLTPPRPHDEVNWGIVLLVVGGFFAFVAGVKWVMILVVDSGWIDPDTTSRVLVVAPAILGAAAMAVYWRHRQEVRHPSHPLAAVLALGLVLEIVAAARFIKSIPFGLPFT